MLGRWSVREAEGRRVGCGHLHSGGQAPVDPWESHSRDEGILSPYSTSFPLALSQLQGDGLGLDKT